MLAFMAAGLATAVGSYYIFTSRKSRIYHYIFAKNTLRRVTQGDTPDDKVIIDRVSAFARGSDGSLRCLNAGVTKEKLLATPGISWKDLIDVQDEIARVTVDYHLDSKDYTVTYMSDNNPEDVISFPPFEDKSATTTMTFPTRILSALLKFPDKTQGLDITACLLRHAGPHGDFYQGTPHEGARFQDILEDIPQWTQGMLITLIDTSGTTWFYDLDEESTINWPSDAESHSVGSFLLLQIQKKQRANKATRVSLPSPPRYSTTSPPSYPTSSPSTSFPALLPSSPPDTPN